MSRREEVEIKSWSEILLMREAGLVVARTLARCAPRPPRHLHPGAGRDRRELHPWRGRYPFVPNYGGYGGQPGFNGSICASVNDEVVHGIPGPTVLREGDLDLDRLRGDP